MARQQRIPRVSEAGGAMRIFLAVAMVATLMATVPFSSSASAAQSGPAGLELMFYEAETGNFAIHNPRNSGLGPSIDDVPNMRKTWHTVVAVDVNGNGEDEILFYDDTTGKAKIHDVDPASGKLGRAFYEGQWRRSWHQIVPVDVDGDGADELFLYDRKNGEATIHNLTNDGKLGNRTYNNKTSRKTWDKFVRIDANGNGQDELVMYDSTRGQGIVYDLTPAGKFGKQLYNDDEWAKNTSTIAAIDFNGDNKEDLLFYSYATGKARVWGVDDDGGIAGQLYHGTWRNNWSQIVPVDIDGDSSDELLLYDSNGNAVFRDMRANGKLGEVLSQGKWRTTWHTITPIEVNGTRPEPTYGVTPPSDLFIHGWRSSSQILVQWSHYENGQAREPDDHGIEYYAVFLDGVLYGTYGPDEHRRIYGTPVDRNRHLQISNLQPSTSYKVEVVAVDYDGQTTTTRRSITTTAGTSPAPSDPPGPTDWQWGVSGDGTPTFTTTELANGNVHIRITWDAAYSPSTGRNSSDFEVDLNGQMFPRQREFTTNLISADQTIDVTISAPGTNLPEWDATVWTPEMEGIVTGDGQPIPADDGATPTGGGDSTDDPSDPYPPTEVVDCAATISAGKRSASVTWSEGMADGANQKAYLLTAWRRWDGALHSVKFSSDESTTIDGLLPGTNYNLKITALNGLGVATRRCEEGFSTGHIPSRDCGISYSTLTEIAWIHWEPEVNLPSVADSYVVLVRNSFNQTLAGTTETHSDEFWAVTTGLEARSHYTIEINAFDSRGEVAYRCSWPMVTAG